MPNTTRRAKAAPKPQTETTPPAAQDQSMFDDTPPAPPEAEQPPVNPAVSSEPATDPAPVDPPADDGETSDAPSEVRLGQVTGLLHRLPLDDVLAYADTFAEKIEALTYTAAVQDLQSRMRVSEGRCAPVYFTRDDDGEPEFLVAGDDALSAAKAIGLDTVFVVTIAPEDAGALQGYLAQQASSTNASTEDDDLVWRANGYHTD